MTWYQSRKTSFRDRRLFRRTSFTLYLPEMEDDKPENQTSQINPNQQLVTVAQLEQMFHMISLMNKQTQA